MFCTTLLGFISILMCTASDLGCRQVVIMVEVCQRQSSGTDETKNRLQNIGFGVISQHPVFAVSSCHDSIRCSDSPLVPPAYTMLTMHCSFLLSTQHISIRDPITSRC